MRTIVVWVLTKGAALLLKLPMASLRFLATVGGYLLEGRNRKILVILVTTAAVVTASRQLVNQANRKRIQRESQKLFSRFHTRFATKLNLSDADDDELM